MQTIARLFMLFFLAIAFVSAGAPVVTISPLNASVVSGAPLQLTATVAGSPHAPITWSAGGVMGGNATSGMINPSGVYTAPKTLPGQNPVLITATSGESKASTYVLILNLGPTVTSVSPNPLPAGSETVTVYGSGFKPGATIYQSDGNGGATQCPTTYVSPTTLTAPIYQGAATSVSFFAKNQSSGVSNSVTVAVSPPAPAKFKLTVVNGSGSGSYGVDTEVTIVANVATAGELFLDWTGATMANANSPSTTLKMPASNVTVQANYKTGPTYTLTVINGTGSGSYGAGATVGISANAPPTGEWFLDWTGATVVNADSSPTTLTMPAANTTVTANYKGATTYALTVVNGTGSGSYAAGATVSIRANTPPAGESFLNWSGATVANARSSTTTLTMPAASTTVTANYAPSTSAAAIPFPVASHPRLWVTAADLPRLRSWAMASNLVYKQGLQSVLQTAVHLYNTQFFPGGVANPNYPDPGDVQGYAGYLTEEYGAILAFNSLIDANPANRILYAQYARNLLMHAMNQAALGPMAGAPFRDPMFAVFNHASLTGEEWPLIVDWIYNAVDGSGNPILTAGDKLTIRNVFMQWAAACEGAATTGGDSPQVPGVLNNFQLLPNDLPYRMAANNYYTAHARLMTMMALAMDPSDDPPVNPAVAGSVLGNSLRSYLSDALGAWLYQQYAMYGEPGAVAGAYGIPGNGVGFGLASGGLPAEGMLYGVSYGNLLQGLLALQTAGFNNSNYESYTGPQIAMIATPMWDRYVRGMISSLIPVPFTPSSPEESYLGEVYQFASYGDLLRLYVTPDFMMPFTLLALLEQENGETTHLADARWFNYNVVQGGPAAFYNRMTDPYTFADTILYYLLYDPAVAYAAAPDPRPGYPTVFVDPGGGRIVAHSDWTPSGNMFDYRASWESINHQDGNAGLFELYRKGEWLTKELSNYDSNGLGLTTYYHNTLGLQNTSSSGSPQVGWWEAGELANGSQWMIAQNAGDPTTLNSSGPGYIYAATDMTKLYNRPDYWAPANAMDNVTQATRSILWFNNDYIVVYDRATTRSPGLFKRWNLTLIDNPTIEGHVATQTLASGQQLFVQSLLPVNGSIAARYVLGDLSSVAELEPSRYVMTIQDASNPVDTRFLHVLQGADAGAAMTTATYVQSASGTAFDGAAFGTTVVYFPVSANASFGTTVLPVQSGVHTLILTGLAPNGSYSASVRGTTVTVEAGGPLVADGAGLLVVTF